MTPMDLNNLYVLSDDHNMPRLCKVHMINPDTKDVVDNLDDLEEVDTFFQDLFDNCYVWAGIKRQKDLERISFKTLLEDNEIFQSLGIQSSEVADMDKIQLLWEWLKNAIMLENYEKELAVLQSKRQARLDYQALLEEKGLDFDLKKCIRLRR